jgi:hypothetical protein
VKPLWRLEPGVIVANVNREVLPSTVCGQPVIGRDDDGLVPPGDIKVRHVVDADLSGESLDKDRVKERLHRNPLDGNGIEVLPGFQRLRDIQAGVSPLSEDVGDFESQQIRGDGTIDLAKDSRKENARILRVFFPEKPLDGDRGVGT